MSSDSGTEIVPGRPHTHADWEALMDQALLAGESATPTLEQCLTRLHYLDDAFIPVPEWEELDWLIQEARHFHERRQSKHWLWKWFPRRRLQAQVEHYLLRACNKAAAILKTLDDRFLLLRGRSSTPPVARTASPPPWHPVEEQAQRSRNAGSPADVWAAAAFLKSLAPSLEFLLEATVWLESDPAQSQERRVELADSSWHANEAGSAGRPRSTWKQIRQAAEANRLTLISQEKLASALRHLRQRLVLWDSGWSAES